MKIRNAKKICKIWFKQKFSKRKTIIFFFFKLRYEIFLFETDHNYIWVNLVYSAWEQEINEFNNCPLKVSL